MSWESTLIKIIKSLGFSGNRKIDVLSLILSLVFLAVLVVLAPDFASRLWFLTIALYFAFRLSLEWLFEFIQFLKSQWNEGGSFKGAIEPLRDEEKALVAQLLSHDGKWGRFQANDNLTSWVSDLQDAGVLEARRSPPKNQIEQLEESMGGTFIEVRMTKACSKFLKKWRFKNARKLGLVE